MRKRNRIQDDKIMLVNNDCNDEEDLSDIYDDGDHLDLLASNWPAGNQTVEQ